MQIKHLQCKDYLKNTTQLQYQFLSSLLLQGKYYYSQMQSMPCSLHIYDDLNDGYRRNGIFRLYKCLPLQSLMFLKHYDSVFILCDFSTNVTTQPHYS